MIYGEKSIAVYFSDVTLFQMYIEINIYCWGTLQDAYCKI